MQSMRNTRFPKRVKLLRISYELLLDLMVQNGPGKLFLDLALPHDAKIVAVSGDVYFSTSEVAFKIESEMFPEVPEGYATPCIEYTPQQADLTLSVQAWREIRHPTIAVENK